MFNNNNPMLLVLLGCLIFMLFRGYSMDEHFTANGIHHPAGYCDDLTYVYYNPQDPDSKGRNDARMKMCEDIRKGDVHEISDRRV